MLVTPDIRLFLHIANDNVKFTFHLIRSRYKKKVVTTPMPMIFLSLIICAQLLRHCNISISCHANNMPAFVCAHSAQHGLTYTFFLFFHISSSDGLRGLQVCYIVCVLCVCVCVLVCVCL